MKETVIVIEAIPYREFRERIRIVREVLKERPRMVEIHSEFVYIEREERAS